MSRFASIKIVSYLWLGSIFGAGCAFLTQVLLARELGPENFGVFAAALGMVTLVTPLACFGIGGFWLKAFGQEGWQAMRWLRGSFLFAVITTTLVLAALFAWARLGPHDATTRGLLVVLSAYLLGQTMVELVSAKLQLEERYVGLAAWQFLPHLLRLLLVSTFSFVLMEQVTLYSVAYAYSFISVGVFFVGVYFIWQLYSGYFELKGHSEASAIKYRAYQYLSIRKVAAESWPFGLAGIFHLIYFQSDIVLLKYLVDDNAAGIYNVAFLIMSAVYILPSVIYQKYLLPKIHRWASHDRKRFYQIYRVGNLIMMALGLLAMLSIWILGSWGVRFLFGDNYADAFLPLMILALAAPIRFVATSVGSVLVTTSHMRRKAYYMGAVAVINIALNFLLIPKYGVAGAAITTVMSELLLLALYFLGARVVFSKEIEVIK